MAHEYACDLNVELRFRDQTSLALEATSYWSLGASVRAAGEAHTPTLHMHALRPPTKAATTYSVDLGCCLGR